MTRFKKFSPLQTAYLSLLIALKVLPRVCYLKFLFLIFSRTQLRKDGLTIKIWHQNMKEMELDLEVQDPRASLVIRELLAHTKSLCEAEYQQFVYSQQKLVLHVAFSRCVHP